MPQQRKPSSGQTGLQRYFNEKRPQAQAQYDETGVLPENYVVGDDGQVYIKKIDPMTGAQKLFVVGTAAAATLGMAGAIPGIAGVGSSASGAAGAAVPGAASAGGGFASTVPNAILPLSGETLAGGAGAGSLGTVGSLVNGANEVSKVGRGTKILDSMSGRDWVSLGLGLTDMAFGGDDSPFQEKTSFRGAGAADPRKHGDQLATDLRSLMQAISSAPDFQRSSGSYLPPPPGPVSIPGLDIQIGGGLGKDPAMRHQAPPPPGENPFSSLFGNANQAAIGGGQDPTRPVRRRSVK